MYRVFQRADPGGYGGEGDPGGDSGSGGQGGADLRGSAAGGGVRTYAGVLGKAGYDEGVCLLNRVKRS